MRKIRGEGLIEDSATPGVIRAACRERFYGALGVLTEIAEDSEARSADRIKAIHELGAFGLGSADQAAVHIHAGEGSQVIGVVRLPEIRFPPTGEGEGQDELAADGEAKPTLALPAGETQ